MAITGVSVYAIERAERQRETAQLGQIAQSVASGLERRANASSAYLRSGAALFATQRVVEAPLFQTFIGQLHLNGTYAGSDGIGWAMKVNRQDIPTVEDVIRRNGDPAFAIRPRPAASARFVVPIMYLQPDSERNRRAIGFDMHSEPVRRSAMQTAERLGRPTATGKVVLQQEGPGGGSPGFLIYMPVYGLGGTRVEQNLRGFVYSPFNARQFLEASIDTVSMEPAGIRLYDQAVAPANLLAEVPLASRSGLVARRAIDLAGRRWVLEVEAPASAMLSGMSVMTLLFGLLVATLLLVLARVLTHQASEDREALAWFEQQASIRNSLTRELNHRVKNTLANVLSIIALTRRRATSLDSFADSLEGRICQRRATSLDSFADSLEGRIRALSATHDLLTQSEWGATPIRAIVKAEMAPYAQDAERHLVLDGPDVDLAPNDALSLGLAIHELATNAAKYGALSVEDGQVSVRWAMVADNLARIEWQERGGPAVSVSGRRERGFGTDLIEKIVAHELRNPVDLRFDPEGVSCTLTVPVRRRGDFAIRESKA
ncbi:CHASE domain-containing protein [Novosphingobium sp. NBM11]|uniref:CHASE domain-containing protein n=1 Tax=Novosphingobium sp. NBM11 TaxID=2596914 RepID=UPI0021050EC8|nr:CHASE domain-containing protein [Novosphingobium sp. NBM11]